MATTQPAGKTAAPEKKTPPTAPQPVTAEAADKRVSEILRGADKTTPATEGKSDTPPPTEGKGDTPPATEVKTQPATPADPFGDIVDVKVEKVPPRAVFSKLEDAPESLRKVFANAKADGVRVVLCVEWDKKKRNQFVRFMKGIAAFDPSVKVLITPTLHNGQDAFAVKVKPAITPATTVPPVQTEKSNVPAQGR